MYKRKLVIISILKVIIATIVIFIIFSRITPAKAASSSFSVSPNIPKNQIGNNQGYFNLLMSPESSQTLSFTLNNSSSEAITIETEFAHSTTNQNGLAIYDLKNSTIDNSLKYNIEDYVDISKKEIMIAAHSQVNWTAQVNMPKGLNKGVMAGGFTFKEKEGNHHSTNKTSGVNIINEYRYVVALVIRQNQTEVTPLLVMNKIKPTQVNSRNVFTFNLQNKSATYIQDMEVQATVQNKNDTHIEYKYDHSNMKMAPNSNFDLFIPTSTQGGDENQSSQKLQPGSYHVSMTVYALKSDKGTYEKVMAGKTEKYVYKWAFDRDFVVPKAKAAALNESDPTIATKESVNWFIVTELALILFIIVLIILLLIFFKRGRRVPGNEE